MQKEEEIEELAVSSALTCIVLTALSTMRMFES
jgi:hypothetical protein